MIKNIYGNRHIVLWGIFLLALLVRCYGLSEQPPTDDEVGAASAATNYMSHGLFGQVMWYHPPLRNIVVFISGKIFGGYSAWGLRSGSIIFGSLAVLLLGYLVYGLFGKRLAAYLAAFFLCIDPLHISLSREAFQETTTSFFIVAGVLAAYHGIRKDNVFLAYLSGALFGIASASKWNGLFPWAVSAAAYYAAPWLLNGMEGRRKPFFRSLTVLSAYAAVPLICYIAVYVPWLLRGYSMEEFVKFQLWLVKHQYFYKGTPYTEDILSHSAYQWFLWPVAWVDFVFHQGKAYLNIAFGNYPVWVLTLPALYFAIREWFKSRSFELGYVILMFSASYLPLVFTTRAIWVFIATPVILFAFTLSAYAISALLDNKKISLKFLAIYLFLAVVFSAVMYPMATFGALEYSWMKPIAEIYSPHK
ncbi:MAG: phospholipid carrier-dependent glycosyltransferase [Nitrospirae bacterium]|nr:MAG: phospholipid carrier-dependent glycosyltransferase [Nitrospirota bacterium]